MMPDGAARRGHGAGRVAGRLRRRASSAEFLAVPQECLILTMQQNQKYFALQDDAGPAAEPLPAGVAHRRRRPARRSSPATRAWCARGWPTPSSSTTRTARRTLESRGCRGWRTSSITTSSARSWSASSGITGIAVRDRQGARRRPHARRARGAAGQGRPAHRRWSASSPSCRA
ncbi:MAG: hypothetical protein MZW92_08570 [Comamonadaceae bacterium]|nr:hypothetical protein [Comamonadaceae bacterium]